jgi:hypothetical protein
MAGRSPRQPGSMKSFDRSGITSSGDRPGAADALSIPARQAGAG